MDEARGPRVPGVPVLPKTDPELAWPEDQRIFYILARNGLHVCRNHEFFVSCVPAEQGPSELEEQATFLVPDFPRIPRTLFERAVGFFDRVAERHGSEAAVLLVWDRQERRVRLVVPEQTASMSSGWSGHAAPVGVHYLTPTDLPSHWVPFGDVHSLVYGAAYASHTDCADEAHAAGLHVVVGRIHREPPEVHVDAVVDGRRFALSAADVIEGYRRRSSHVPAAWIERVTVTHGTQAWYSGGAT